MSRGHVTGEKKERKGASDWYKEIEEAAIREVEQAWDAAAAEEAQRATSE